MRTRYERLNVYIRVEVTANTLTTWAYADDAAAITATGFDNCHDYDRSINSYPLEQHVSYPILTGPPPQLS
jgi:hypothetical protein